MTDAITIPDHLLPADGRFGAGPSKVRLEALLEVDRTLRSPAGIVLTDRRYILEARKSE